MAMHGECTMIKWNNALWVHIYDIIIIIINQLNTVICLLWRVQILMHGGNAVKWQFMAHNAEVLFYVGVCTSEWLTLNFVSWCLLYDAAIFFVWRCINHSCQTDVDVSIMELGMPILWMCTVDIQEKWHTYAINLLLILNYFWFQTTHCSRNIDYR
jgi:hypothetical protein